MLHKLCFVTSVCGVIMLIIGIIVLVTAPKRPCPEGCERQTCTSYSNGGATATDFDCTCPDTGSCRNRVYRTGSPGYYHLVFGVLGVVLGGLAFLGGIGTVLINACTEQQARNRAAYGPYAGAWSGGGSYGAAY